jgi:hypothetical protein
MMLHKYKTGAVVHYNPGQKSVRALGKRYTIIAFMPKLKGSRLMKSNTTTGICVSPGIANSGKVPRMHGGARAVKYKRLEEMGLNSESR